VSPTSNDADRIELEQVEVPESKQQGRPIRNLPQRCWKPSLIGHEDFGTQRYHLAEHILGVIHRRAFDRRHDVSGEARYLFQPLPRFPEHSICRPNGRPEYVETRSTDTRNQREGDVGSIRHHSS
jgi:hypothetical protein